MKNIFRAIGFSLAVTAFSATGVIAQANPCDDPFETKDAEYKKFRENIKAPLTVEKLETAVTVGTNFNTKYATCEDTKAVVKYINDKMPVVKETLADMKLSKKFDDGVGKNWADAFSAGKEIIAAKSDKPVSLDVAIVLALAGYDLALEKNDTYNSDTIMMAETVIKKLESNMTSEKYGAFGKYELKIKEYPDGKQNALGWMNYIIGFIKGERQNNKKDGMAYLYKATKFNSAVKNFPDIYQGFGSYYIAEFDKIEAERIKLYTDNGNKENEQTLAMWDLQKGYLDRAIDAYSRAYKIASDIERTAPADKKAAAKTYKDTLYKSLGTLYKNRFDKTEGLDAHIAAVLSKPMPDPSTEVQPVKEATPTTTTGGTTSTTTTTTNPTNNTTKTTTTTTTKPTATTTTTTKPTANTTTTKPKKTTPKKKGSR
jgi:tetratricopeptide (TPR) repeat protein